MLVDVNELIGDPLDWLVAKLQRHEWRCPWMLEPHGYAEWQQYEIAWGSPTPKYSTDWTHGGPIIEREEIGIRVNMPYFDGNKWEAIPSISTKGAGGKFGRGPTPLIAAMRCYVASNLGKHVEVPDELLNKD